MRALMVAVVVMGVLIVGGTVALGVLFVQRLGGVGGGEPWSVALNQPDGTRISGVAAGEGGIVVWVLRPDGERVLVVDPKRGRVLGEIRPGR